MNANKPLFAPNAATGNPGESDDDRLLRLHNEPEAAAPADVAWLTGLVRIGHVASEALREELQVLKLAVERFKERDIPGRVIGLREAAGLIRAAANKEVTARFLVGKKENAARAMNSKLMHSVAGLIDRYADDAEKGAL